MLGPLLMGVAAFAVTLVTALHVGRLWIERRLREAPFDRRYEIKVVTKKTGSSVGENLTARR